MAGTNSMCPFYRGVCLIESQTQGVKKGRDQLRLDKVRTPDFRFLTVQTQCCRVKLRTSHFLLPTSHFPLLTSDSTSDFQLPTSDFRLDSSVRLDCRSIRHGGINAQGQSSLERTAAAAVPFSPQKGTFLKSCSYKSN